MILKTNKNLRHLFVYCLAFFFLILFGFPFLFMLFTSFKDQGQYLKNYWLPPTSFYFGNFVNIIEPTFLRYFFNTAMVSILSVAGVVSFGSMVAYALTVIKFRLSPVILLIFLAGMMIPTHTALIPTYFLTIEIGMQDKTLGLLGPYISFGLPIAVYIMSSFFKDVPGSIRESAVVDGASPFVVYSRIIMPLSLPAISTVAIYNFLFCWNEFIFALTLVTRTSQKTLSIGIREFSAFQAVNIPNVITAIFVGSLPVMVFYFLAQEQVINGLSSGAVKG
jgi:raffinose/stachyose/melibiose transport system permease protein